MSGVISVAMIVKNEESELPGALESLASLGSLLHEVCIYDTGSTDKTIEIAGAWGTRVERGYWDDDFSRARNAALSMVRSPWCLVVDADERVNADERMLSAALRRAGQSGLEALVVTMNDVRPEGVANSAPSIRLFRTGLVEYGNRIHENVRRVGSEQPPRSARLATECLNVAHYGYGVPEKDALRSERNLRLSEVEVASLRAQRASAERLAQALVDRARSRGLAGDATGALKDFQEAWVTTATSPFRAYAGERLAEGAIESGDLDLADELLDELAAHWGDYEYRRLLKAQILQCRGQHQAAYDVLRKLERPTNMLGEDRFVVPLLSLRALTAASAGRDADALAAALTLTVQYGEVETFGRLALVLWGDRSLQGLAAMLEPLTQELRERLLRAVKGMASAAELAVLLEVSGTPGKSRSD